MTNPAVVVGTPKLFLKFTADAPTNTTDVGQILLDGIFLNELVPPPRASTTYDGATWTVTGEGTGIASTWDLLRLVGRHVSGDLTMVTRVVSMSDSGAAATAGLMVRENHAGGSPFVALQRTGAGGVVMRWRSSDGGAMQSIAASGPSGASTWLRLTRVGTSVTTSVSSDGQAWSTIGACNVTFATNPYLAGYVVSTSTSGVPNTVAFSNGFQAKPGDVNRDGMVDAADRDLLLGQFGLRSVDSSWDSRIDLNQDGRVDASDLGLVLRQLGH